MDKLSRAKILTSNSNVLINGGTTSVGMFAIQLLKRYYKLDKKLVIVTSGNGPDVLEAKFPDLAGEMLFINYLSCRGKSSKPLKTMIQERKAIAYHSALELGQSDSELKSETEIEYTQGKFDVVLDFVGGYDILAHSSSLIMPQGPTSQQLEITLQTIARMYLTLGIIRVLARENCLGLLHYLSHILTSTLTRKLVLRTRMIGLMSAVNC